MSLKIFNFSTMSAKDKERIIRRSVANYEQLIPLVKAKMEEVRTNGDSTILKKYRERNIPIQNLQVTNTEVKKAYQDISSDFILVLKQVIKNITTVNIAQLKTLTNEKLIKVRDNDICVWRSWKPIESIGIYVPGGNANYPSSLLMCGIPAIIAGCRKIIVCCPPDKNGKLPNEVLVAARKLGITKIYKIGGPQAVAAMSYGTKTIPKVQKIVGPGNEYVTIAKLLVYPQTNIDMPAGPSEDLIIADETANPVFVAADLITDAEHGIDSTGVLLTTSMKLAKQVQSQINKQVKTLSSKNVIETALASFGAIIVFTSLKEMINFANEYAPEHMQIMTKNPEKVGESMFNAGSIFIGPWTTKSSGDYATGANHVLPTGQMAKTFGPLSVENFGKLVQYQKVTQKGLRSLKKTIVTFADVEKLPAHKNSVTVRFSKNPEVST